MVIGLSGRWGLGDLGGGGPRWGLGPDAERGPWRSKPSIQDPVSTARRSYSLRDYMDMDKRRPCEKTKHESSETKRCGEFLRFAKLRRTQRPDPGARVQAGQLPNATFLPGAPWRLPHVDPASPSRPTRARTHRPRTGKSRADGPPLHAHGCPSAQNLAPPRGIQAVREERPRIQFPAPHA